MGGTRFKKLCMSVPLASDIEDIAAAATLATALFDPVLDGSADGKVWNPSLESWR